MSEDGLPKTGFLRLNSILAPDGPVPVSKSTWWDGSRKGRYPAPVKLGPRITAWRVEDIRALIKRPPPDNRPDQLHAKPVKGVPARSVEREPPSDLPSRRLRCGLASRDSKELAKQEPAPPTRASLRRDRG